MAQTIKIKRSSTSGNKLTSSNSVAGELGLNTADKALYIQTGSSNGDVVTVAHESTLKIDESNNRVGIGTSSPSEKLHVTDTVFIDYPDGSGTSLKIGRNDSSNYWEVGHAGGDFRLYNTAGSGSDILFGVQNGGVDQGNKVGIGTATPDKKLTVDGDVKVGNGDAFMSANVAGSTRSLISLGTDNILRIKGNDPEGSGNVISMINGGNVGIGTTSPASLLHIRKANNTQLITESVGDYFPSTSIKRTGGSSKTNYHWEFQLGSSGFLNFKDRTNSYYPIILNASGDVLLASDTSGQNPRMFVDQSTGNVGIGTTSPGAPLDVKSNSVSSGNSGIRLISNSAGNAIVRIGEKSNDKARFHMYDGTTEKIAFYADGTANHISAGNLGIGTSAPARMFTVQGVSGDNLPVRIIGGAGTSHGSMEFQDPNTTADYKVTIGSKADDFYIQAGGGEKVRVKANGNVGIGTSSPAFPLHINSSSTDVAKFQTSGSYSFTRFQSSSRTWALSIGSNFSIYDEGSSSTRFVIDTSGNVGIGTSSPAGLLHIKHASGEAKAIIQAGSNTSSAVLQFGDSLDTSRGAIEYTSTDDMAFSTNNMTEAMRIRYTGSVGIGTSNPSGTLHVKSTGNGEVNIERASGALINLQAQASAAYIGTNSNHLFGLKANGSVRLKISTGGAITFNDEYTFPTADGSANQVLKTDGSGNLSFVTIAGAGGVTEIADADDDTKIQVEESSDEDKIRFDAAGVERFRIGSDIEVVAATDFNITGSNRRLNFTSGTGTVRTTGASSLHLATNNTNRLTITSSGSVGIGTISPSSEVHISQGNQALGFDAGLYISANPSDYTVGRGSGITMQNADVITAGIYGVRHAAGWNGGLAFYTHTATSGNTFGSTFTEKMRIDDEGNVGIGTTAPTHQLHVAGAGDIVIEDTGGGSAHLRLKSSASGSTTSHWKLKTNAANHFYIDNDQQGTSNLTILSDGRAGIGISAPTAALSVVDTSQTTTGQGLAGLRVHRPNATSQYGYVDYDHSGGGINVGSFYSGGGNSVYGTFMFRQHNAAGSQIPMAIGNTGNVGFGTTSPGDKIHLATGNILFERGRELRSKDTGGNLRTLVRVNSSNELEYGWSASGPVKFMGGTSYTERMRVHTNGNIGIGTTSPSRKLDISASGNDGIRIASGNALIGGGASGGDTQLIYWSSGNVYYGRSALGGSVSQHEFRTGGATRLTITSSGYVGIGTTSPSQKLQVNGALVSTDQLTSPGSAGSYTYNATALDYSSNGARFWSWGSSTARGTFNFIQLENDGQNQQTAMSIDTSGNVGIGTTSISSALSGSNKTLKIEDDDGADIRLVHTGGIDFTLGITNSNTAYIWNAGSHNILFGTAGTERMRLNSAGDLLIGKTSTGAGTAGIAFLQQDIITTTRSGGYSLLASRLTSDGEIIRIQRSGTTVGEIGSEGGDSLYISGATSTGSGLRFHPSAGNILPVRNRVTIDSTIDLGSSARRFRNIHASSAVNVGHASIQSDSTTTSATTQVAIDAFVASEFRSAEFTIQVTNSTDSTYHITKVLLIHDGTTPGITEYGTVFTGSAAEATFDADISSGAVRLLATPASTDSMTFKVVRHCITV